MPAAANVRTAAAARYYPLALAPSNTTRNGGELGVFASLDFAVRICQSSLMDADDPIRSRLAYYESEEQKARELAAQYIAKADGHREKIRAYRLVLDDLEIAPRRDSAGPEVARAEGPIELVGVLPTPTNPSPVAAPPGDQAGEEDEGGEKALSESFIDLVRGAVARQPEEFEGPWVRATLDEMAPGAVDAMRDRSALNKALNRMADKEEIFRVREGRGKRPARYSKRPVQSVVALARFKYLEDLDSEADDNRPEGGGE